MTRASFAWSLSAPAISDNDALHEREQLTPAQLHDIEKDLYGNNSYRMDFLETEEVQANALAQLQEAVGTMPDMEKVAFLEALEKCPELVERESNPFLFMRLEEYNIWAAARRLCKYWTMRKRVFGDSAFRPMDQSPQGALSPEDIALLKSGVVFVLPDDKSGRRVLCYEKSRVNYDNYDRMGLARCFFYNFHLCQEHPHAITRGVIMMVNVMKFNPYQNDRALMKYSSDMGQYCFPFRIVAFHVNHHGLKTISTMFIPIIRFVMVESVRHRLVIHIENDRNKFREDYVRYGIEAEGLPTSLGGNWGLDQIAAILDRRRQFEMHRFHDQMAIED